MRRVAPKQKMYQQKTRNTLHTKELPHRKTPYSPWTYTTAKHPLTVDLAHRGTPHSPWTCPTAEYATHRPQNTLITVDLPIAEHPTYLGPAQRGTPYSNRSKKTFKWSRFPVYYKGTFGGLKFIAKQFYREQYLTKKN